MILAPHDVSLICADSDLTFAWCNPSIAHIRWDRRPVVRRVVRWANDIARGRDDLRKTFTKVRFVEGGTIGPVPKRQCSGDDSALSGTDLGMFEGMDLSLGEIVASF